MTLHLKKMRALCKSQKEKKEQSRAEQSRAEQSRAEEKNKLTIGQEKYANAKLAGRKRKGDVQHANE